MQRFRGGLVFKTHRPCVSLNSRLESNNEEEEVRSKYSVVDAAFGDVVDNEDEDEEPEELEHEIRAVAPPDPH